MGDKTNQRADKTKVTGIRNERNMHGQYIMPGNETRLRKNLERFTMSCDMSGCDGDGYYDSIGEVICEHCGRVISQRPESHNEEIVYADKYSQGMDDPESGTGNRGSSGHPLMRVPSLSDAGPSGDDSMGGVS